MSKISEKNWVIRRDSTSKQSTGWDTALKDRNFTQLVGKIVLLFIVLLGASLLLQRIAILNPMIRYPESNIVILIVLVSGIFYLLLQELVRGFYLQSRKQVRFLSDASHELRTPLTIMRTELEISLRHVGSVEQNVESFKNVLSEVKRMQKIVEDLLNLSKLESGREVLTPEPVNIVDLLLHLEKSMKSYAKTKNIIISTTVNLPAKNRHVVGSYDQLLQALRNLVKNAIEYSKPEGGHIRLEVGKGRLSDLNMIIVRISDEGIGISSKDLPHIFDRFYQVNKARALEQGKGSGLGLAIAHWIIHNFGGELMIASKLGVGTTAIVRLKRYDWQTPSSTEDKGVIKPIVKTRVKKQLLPDGKAR